MSKKLIEKSRECHNYKPQPTPDTKRKRKMTKTNAHKTNKQMHEKHTDQLPLFWHIFDIRAESLLRLTIFFRYYSTRAVFDIRAKPKYKVLYAKMLFWDFLHSSWVIFRYYSTRVYLSSSAKNPIFDLVWDKDINHCLGTYMFSLVWIFMKLADNQNRDTVLNVFEFEPDQTFHYRVICPWVPKDYIRHCQEHYLFSFNRILWTWLADNQDGHIYIYNISCALMPYDVYDVIFRHLETHHLIVCWR